MHWHSPLTHCSPLLQATAQPPQLPTSPIGSTQFAPQAMSPAAHPWLSVLVVTGPLPVVEVGDAVEPPPLIKACAPGC